MASQPRDTNLNIPVGSAYVYCVEFTGEIPENTEIEVPENHLGDIEAGLTLTYSATSETLKDDYGHVKRNILTDEDVKAKMGLITWNYQRLQKLVSTARVTEDAAKKTRTVKIGGIGNDNGKQWLFRFVHVDKKLGNVRITIVGTNTGGLELVYQKDAATKLEPEITALASDDEGTLIIFEESLPESSSAMNGGE